MSNVQISYNYFSLTKVFQGNDFQQDESGIEMAVYLSLLSLDDDVLPIL